MTVDKLGTVSCKALQVVPGDPTLPHAPWLSVILHLEFPLAESQVQTEAPEWVVWVPCLHMRIREEEGGHPSCWSSLWLVPSLHQCSEGQGPSPHKPVLTVLKR